MNCFQKADALPSTRWNCQQEGAAQPETTLPSIPCTHCCHVTSCSQWNVGDRVLPSFAPTRAAFSACFLSPLSKPCLPPPGPSLNVSSARKSSRFPLAELLPSSKGTRDVMPPSALVLLHCDHLSIFSIPLGAPEQDAGSAPTMLGIC